MPCNVQCAMSFAPRSTSRSARTATRSASSMAATWPSWTHWWRLVIGAGVIAADPPWLYETYSGKGKDRSAERHYDTPSFEWVMKEWVPRVRRWRRRIARCSSEGVRPLLPDALELIRAYGFIYKSKGFCWEKTNADGSPFMGMGLSRGQISRIVCLRRSALQNGPPRTSDRSLRAGAR